MTLPFYKLLPTVLLACGFVFSMPGDDEPREAKPVSTKLGYPVYKLEVKPFHHEDDHPDAFWRVMRTLESDGKQVYFGSDDAGVVQLDANGRFIKRIGRGGKGPGEYEQRLLALLVQGKDVWVLDRQKLLHYEDGVFRRDIRLQSNKGALFAVTSASGSNNFDVTDQFILLPFGKEAAVGQVGSVYSRTGKLLRVIEDPGFDKHLIQLSSFAQKIMWRHFEAKWYGAYMYTPRVIVLDKDFTLIREMTALDSPEIRDYEENFFAENRGSVSNPKRNIPLFLMLQIVNGVGFLKGHAGLHRFDLATGEITALYHFKLDDTEWGVVYPAGFQMCAILENGKVVLANNVLKGELFYATLPDFTHK